MTNPFFADRLIDLIREKQSIVCVGLDPRCEGTGTIPRFLVEEYKNDYNKIIWEFNKAIIDATIDCTPVYKPQSAFYEQYEAMDALKKTIEYVHQKGALAILDAKRSDIGSTCEAYAIAAFKVLNADAITVNAYLGIDGVAPFLKYTSEGKGTIILIKTSNKSSGEFQDLFALEQISTDPKTPYFSLDKAHLVRNYIIMTRLMKNWAVNPEVMGTTEYYGGYGYSSLGGVVGATYPEQLVNVRKEIPQHFILIPGYGVQGGTVKEIIHGVNSDGLGAIVNASRSINYAYDIAPYKAKCTPKDFAKAAKMAVEDMRKEINQGLKAANKLPF